MAEADLIIPESNKWADFAWPDWVPEEWRKNIEKFWTESWGRGPKSWASRTDYDGLRRPEFGECVTLFPISKGEARTGRFIHTWNNMCVVVPDDGSEPFVSSQPGTLGPWHPPAVYTTEKSAAMEHVGSSTLAVHRISKGSDWCDFTIDDEHGTLHVTGDHGSWTYRWGGRITPSIAYRFGPDYMANKLSTRKTEHDAEATEKAVREDVLRRRREGSFTSEEAREVWDELEFVEWGSADLVVDALSRIQIGDYRGRRKSSVFEESWELLQTSMRYDYTHLRDVYLPALIDLLRALPSPTPDPLSGTVVTHG